MYRTSSDYDTIAKAIIDIYCDYNIVDFPTDEKEVCRKLGIQLIPYSNYSGDSFDVLITCSSCGFFTNETTSKIPTIFYNDVDTSKKSQRFTIFHEIKHYVFEDADDSNDDLSDYFSRYFMCPIPFMLLKGIETPKRIYSFCDMSWPASENAAVNIRNRKSKYGLRLFNYEHQLIEHLDPILYKNYVETNGGGGAN